MNRDPETCLGSFGSIAGASVGGLEAECSIKAANNADNSPHHVADQLERLGRSFASFSEQHHVIKNAVETLRNQIRSVDNLAHAVARADDTISGLRRRIDMASFALTASK